MSPHWSLPYILHRPTPLTDVSAATMLRTPKQDPPLRMSPGVEGLAEDGSAVDDRPDVVAVVPLEHSKIPVAKLVCDL